MCQKSFTHLESEENTKDETVASHHYRGVGIRIQSSDQSVSFRVDVSFPLDGLLVHRVTVHVKRDQLLLHAHHHFVPFSVEEDGKTRKGDGLDVSFHGGEEELQGLLVSIQTHTCLLQAVFIHHLPDVPHLVHSVLDHAEGGHEGILIREAPWKVQPGGK